MCKSIALRVFQVFRFTIVDSKLMSITKFYQEAIHELREEDNSTPPVLEGKLKDIKGCISTIQALAFLITDNPLRVEDLARDISTLYDSIAHLSDSVHDLGREAKAFFFPQTVTPVMERSAPQEYGDIIHQIEHELKEPVTLVDRNFYHEEAFKAGVEKPPLEKKIVNVYECENASPMPIIQPQSEERKLRMPMPIPRLAKPTTVLSSNDIEAPCDTSTHNLSSQHTSQRHSHTRDPLTEELKKVVQKRKQQLSHIHNPSL